MLGRGIMGDTQERFNMGSDPLGIAIARDYGSVNQPVAYVHPSIGMSSNV
jgi:hypothetical protein